MTHLCSRQEVGVGVLSCKHCVPHWEPLHHPLAGRGGDEAIVLGDDQAVDQLQATHALTALWHDIYEPLWAAAGPGTLEGGPDEKGVLLTCNIQASNCSHICPGVPSIGMVDDDGCALWLGLKIR